MQRRKNYISLFFLVFFIFIKTAGLHSISHSEESIDDIECDVCEFVVSSNNTPVLSSEQVSFEPHLEHNYNKKVCFKYSFQFVQNQIESSLFSRPPPVVNL